MFVALKLFLHVAGHRNVERPRIVIPGKLYTAIKIAGPIFAQFLVLSLYCRYQVIDILFLFVFDSEIVDDKGEGDFAGLVFPKAGRVLAFVVAVGRKSFAKELVG